MATKILRRVSGWGVDDAAPVPWAGVSACAPVPTAPPNLTRQS